MNAIKNQSMLEDKRLSEEDLFEKYWIERGTSIGHIMTKLVEEWVYKVDEVLERELPLYYNEEKVNKVIYDLYKLLEGSWIRENFWNIFSIARTQDFFNYEASFRFINWIFWVLKEKFLNWEITYDSWLKIMKEFKDENWLDLYYDLIDNQKSYKKQRETYLKIKNLLEKIPEWVNQSKLILEFLIKYWYKEDEKIKWYYTYNDWNKETTFWRIPEKLEIDDIKWLFRWIEYILDISYDEAIRVFEDFVNLKIEQTKFVNWLNNL